MVHYGYCFKITIRETIDLQNRLYTNNLNDIKEKLHTLRVRFNLSSDGNNQYVDIRNGKKLSHEDVLNIIGIC